MAIPVLRGLGVLRSAKAVVMAARFLILWSWRSASSRDAAMYASMSVTQEARRDLRATVAMAHAPFVEAPSETLETLRRFLKEKTPGHAPAAGAEPVPK